MSQTVPRQNRQTYKEKKMKILMVVAALAMLVSGCISIG